MDLRFLLTARYIYLITLVVEFFVYFSFGIITGKTLFLPTILVILGWVSYRDVFSDMERYYMTYPDFVNFRLYLFLKFIDTYTIIGYGIYDIIYSIRPYFVITSITIFYYAFTLLTLILNFIMIFAAFRIIEKNKVRKSESPLV